MLRILNLIVCIPIDIIRQEAYALHIREECHGKRQVLDLYGQEERLSRLQVSLGERLENLLIEAYLLYVRVILCHEISTCTEEVSIIGEDETGHNRIQVDDAKHIPILVEHHVVHLRIAMTDTFGQFSFTVKALSLTHLLAVLFQLIDDRLHFLDASFGISLNGFMQLPHAQFHVMEVGDRLT